MRPRRSIRGAVSFAGGGRHMRSVGRGERATDAIPTYLTPKFSRGPAAAKRLLERRLERLVKHAQFGLGSLAVQQGGTPHKQCSIAHCFSLLVEE